MWMARPPNPREKEMSRKAFEKLVSRIIKTNKGSTTERDARKLAERIATRHDRKNGK